MHIVYLDKVELVSKTAVTIWDPTPRLRCQWLEGHPAFISSSFLSSNEQTQCGRPYKENDTEKVVVALLYSTDLLMSQSSNVTKNMIYL